MALQELSMSVGRLEHMIASDAYDSAAQKSKTYSRAYVRYCVGV